MILRPAPVPTAQFNYVAAERKFVGEISSTHGFGRVYDDACDEGLTLVSRTGREVVFVVDSVERESDGTVTKWTLRPADRAGATADLRVVLFND